MFRLRVLLPLLALAVALAYLALPGGGETEPDVAGAGRQGDTPRRGGNAVPDHYVVVYSRAIESAARETEARERGQGFRARFVYGRALKGFSAKLSQRQVERLRADPEVVSVTPEAERLPSTIPSLNSF